MMLSGGVIPALLASCLLLAGCGRGDGPAPPAGSAAVQIAGAPSGRKSGDGELRGRVVYDGAPPGRQKLIVVKDVEVCRRIDHLDDRLVVDRNGGIRYAVVSVRGAGKAPRVSAAAGEFVLDQRACAYDPHVIIVPVGATLKIRNSDGILHNIHTYSSLNRPFNVAQPRGLRVIEKTFTAPERIGVRCDVHGWMSSWVIVVDDDYHAVTDEAGLFVIPDIPAGRYDATCWQEQLGELHAEIVVGEGGGPTLHEFTYRIPGKSGPAD